MGLTYEDIRADAERGIAVWPQNLQAAEVFRGLRTQWRWTNGMMVGLDYNVLYAKLDRLEVPKADASRIEDEVRYMEGAVLELMNERREAQMRKRNQQGRH